MSQTVDNGGFPKFGALSCNPEYGKHNWNFVKPKLQGAIFQTITSQTNSKSY